jgi:2-amino-4-hydroxy-6-hydroxymethyldihydropteridine diphosphokinase
MADEAGGYRKTAFLSLGSNQGDRVSSLERALAALTEAGVQVVRRSGLYETEPVELENQPWFLNCVVEVETELMPLALLRLTQRIERELGRRREGGTKAPAPRPIDIDIVLFGSSVVRLPELTIPHPRMPERRFVLQPLREIAPDLRHPLTRKTVVEMLAELTDSAQVRRYTS